MTTVSNILENLDRENGLEVNKLEKALKITKKNDRQNLSIAINALKKLEIIIDLDDSKLGLNKDVDLIRGRVRCSSKGYCFVVREELGEDIYIREANLNHAWHGDYVIVKITKEGQKRKAPEGSIQCVLERNNDIILTKIEIDSISGDLKAYPLDDRIPVVIDIVSDKNIEIDKNNNDLIYEIKIIKYPIAQYTAVGSIIKELPLNAGTDGDLEILLSKNNIPRNLLIPKISPKKIISKKRLDFTSQPSLIFKSWESTNSPSLPALFAQPYEGGTRIWIHSPTVAERINFGGKLDSYLKQIGEVTCLGNNWLDFLGDSLIKASQFKVNEECEAITLIIDINSKGDVTDWNFSLSKIKPVNIITSKHIECINKRKSASRSIPIAIKPIKDNLEVIYTIIHTSKIINLQDNGSIELDIEIPHLERLSELQKAFPSRDFHGWSKTFDTSDPQSILDVFIRLSSNILAKHLIGYKLPFIYKEHEEIDQASINELSKSALALDKKITINIDGSATTNELLKSFETSTEKKILHKLLKHIIPGINLKLMNECNYFENNEESLDLNVERIECPWCFPALNYWNIVNQFILTSLLIDGKNKITSRSKESINLGDNDSWKKLKWDLFPTKVRDNINTYINKKLIQQLNEIRKKSRLFRNNIISIAQCREAQKIIGNEVIATITGVQSYGFFAEIQDLTVEGLVHVSTLGDDWYEYRSRQNLLVGRKNKKTYQLAQKVKVRVLKVDILKNQIDLELVNNDNSDETKINTNNIE